MRTPLFSLPLGLTAGLLTARLLPTAGAAPAPAEPSPNPAVWLSLGHSTLDSRPPDWEWLRSQCAGGRVLQQFQTAGKNVGGLIVPVFDDGRCFYRTGVSLFRERNPVPERDERSLRELLRAARAKGVPVYLGLDLLAWQKTGVDRPQGLFQRHPQLEELNQYGFADPRPEARYASPSRPETRRALAELLGELAERFPEAAGVVLDVRYSEREIYGFHPLARADFARKHGLDPIDFGLDNIAGLRLNPTLRAWMDARRDGLRRLTVELADNYRKRRAGGRVWINGYAEYYTDRDFHDVRTAQDWLGWLGTGRFDGVLLEGRWLAPFVDIDQLRPQQARVAELSRRLGKPLAVIPMSAGGHLIRTAGYLQEGRALRGRVARLDYLALLMREERDVENGQELLTAGLGRQSPTPLTVGAPLPDFVLPLSGTAAEWNSKSIRGRRGLALVAVPQPERLPAILTALDEGVRRQWRGAGLEPVVVSSQAVPRVSAAPGLVHLHDPQRELLSRVPAEGAFLLVDRAGFLRRNRELPSDPEALHALLHTPEPDPTPPFRVGEPAPEFALTDASGVEVRLSDFRDRRHLLLTFFPKCFTDG